MSFALLPLKKKLDISRDCAIIFSVRGVAQFGSVLEWGSRGREFESRHSDQKICRFLQIFLLAPIQVEIEPFLHYNGDIF